MKQLINILSIQLVALLLSITASFASDLPACPSSGFYNNCFGSFIFGDGEKYVGEWQNDERNGLGTNNYASGEKYVGEWQNDKRNGLGTNTWSNGIKYIGEWKDNKRNGLGYTVWPNGKADFCKYKYDKELNCSGTNVHNVAPILKATFNSLNKDNRKAVQYILREEGIYKSSIDGLWGKNTFVAIAEFAVVRMQTSKFNRRDIAEEIFIEIAQVGPTENIEPNQNNNNSIAGNRDPNQILNAASGTGFFISNKGHIITNHHVINGCSEVKVHTEGKSSTASILAKDQINDLALLKVSQSPQHVFALSNDDPYPLQDIIVAGFPFGDAISSTLKFTTGVISSLAGIGNNYSEIQIDAAIQPGNSGGPIIDKLGNIVGVAVSKLDVGKVYEDFGVIPENTNFGIKASVVKNLLQSNNVELKSPNTIELPKNQLSKITTKGTLHLSCWMTVAQIKKMQSQKALFEKFD